MSMMLFCRLMVIRSEILPPPKLDLVLSSWWGGDSVKVGVGHKQLEGEAFVGVKLEDCPLEMVDGFSRFG